MWGLWVFLWFYFIEKGFKKLNKRLKSVEYYIMFFKNENKKLFILEGELVIFGIFFFVIGVFVV